MINKPSEATSCSFIKLDSIVKDIEQYAVSSDNSQLHPLQNAMGNPLYLLVAGTGCRAKPFGIPVKVQINGNDTYVVDVRQYTSPGVLGAFKITNIPEFDTAGMLGLVTAIWDSADRPLVANIASDLAPIYATWLSSTISAAFNLEIDKRTEVSILAAYYYWVLLDVDSDKDRVAGRIAKDMKIDFDRVIEVIDASGDLTDLGSFVDAIKRTSAGVRLDKFDVATLYQVSAGAWIGANGRTIMEVALEYPAYLVALTNSVLLDRSYRRCRFNDYVKLFDRRTEIHQLPEAVQHLKKQW